MKFWKFHWFVLFVCLFIVESWFNELLFGEFLNLAIFFMVPMKMEQKHFNLTNNFKMSKKLNIEDISYYVSKIFNVSYQAYFTSSLVFLIIFPRKVSSSHFTLLTLLFSANVWLLSNRTVKWTWLTSKKCLSHFLMNQ